MKLRDYQLKAINDIKQHEKNLVFLATGAGKSVIFKQFVLDCVEQKKRVMFIVSGNSILEQAVRKHFAEILSPFEISLMQGQKIWSPTTLLCCSIQTLSRREKDFDFLLNEYDAFVIDEAHNCTSDSYKKFINKIENKTILGLTATPYLIGNKGHDYWDNIIKTINIRQLIEQKYLVFPKCFSAQTKMDTNVQTQNGDYNQKQLWDKNDSSVVYGSIIDEYKKHGNNQKAICFAINIAHSEKIALEFLKQGIKAVHADANTPMEDRLQILKDFEFGDIQVLCNVNIFSTGIDIPNAVVGIMARPTKSRVLWIQQVGRLLRTHPSKQFAIILDHGNNIEVNGHPLTDFAPELTSMDKKTNDEKKEPTYECKSCYYIFSEKTDECPMCGAKNEAKIRKIKEQKEAELKEVKFEEEQKNKWANTKRWYFSKELCDVLDNKTDVNSVELNFIAQTIIEAMNFDYKPNSIFFKIWDVFPETKYLKYPKWFLELHDEKLLPTTPKPFKEV